MLRIVLDEGISREVMQALVAQGHTVDHALDLGLKSQPDPYVFLAAQRRQAIVCSSNRRDFVMLGLPGARGETARTTVSSFRNEALSLLQMSGLTR